MHNQHEQTGIVSTLKQQLNIPDLWLIHRLDTETSGLLLLGKSRLAASALSQQFQNRQINKFYLAISDTKPQKKQGSIIGDMKSARNGTYMLTKDRSNPAVSHFVSHSLSPGKRLYLWKPYTGKTHQLRVSMKSISAPILGDSRYQGGNADRMYLHALQLSFCHKAKQFDYMCRPSNGALFVNEEFEHAFEKMLPTSDHPWPDQKLRQILQKNQQGDVEQ